MTKLIDKITTLPTVGSPTVETSWFSTNESYKSIEVKIETDQKGTLEFKFGQDGISADETDSYNIDKSFYDILVATRLPYCQISYTLQGSNDNNLFELVAEWSETEVISNVANPNHITIDSVIPVSIQENDIVSTVNINNFPASQTINGSVNINNFPATQTVDGTVEVSSLPAVDINNFPASQTVNGSLTIDNFPASQTVNVDNFPASQTVTGTVDVSSLPAVDINNFPASQTVNVNNFPTSQNVNLYAFNSTEQQLVKCDTNGNLQVAGSVSVSSMPSVTVSSLPTVQVDTTTPLNVSDSSSQGALTSIDTKLSGLTSIDTNTGNTASALTTIDGKITACNTNSVVIDSTTPVNVSDSTAQGTLSTINGKITACDTSNVIIDSSTPVAVTDSATQAILTSMATGLSDISTETKQDDMLVALNSIDSKTPNVGNPIDESIRKKNADGKCYVVFNQVSPSGTDNLVYINNPSGSTHTKYIYNITLSHHDDQTPGRVHFKFRMYKGAMTTNGPALEYGKMNFNDTTSYIDADEVGSDGSNTNPYITIYEQNVRSNSGVIAIDFQEEYIILPPNTCLVITCSDEASGGTGYASVRWYQE